MEPGSPTLDNSHFPNLTLVQMSKMGENMQPFSPSSPNYKKLKTENCTGIHFTALMIVLVITNKIIYIYGWKSTEMPPDKKFSINEDNVISAA